MANEDWPESRERLLKDIELFSEKAPEDIMKETAPPPGKVAVVRPAPAPSPVVAASGASPSAAAAQPVPIAPPVSTPTTSSPVTSSPSSSGPSSLLDTLKMQAFEKLQSEEKKSSLQAETFQRMSLALERAFLYLNDLTRQLNILKPRYVKAYPFFGIVDFDQMSWMEGRADFRMQQTATDDRYYEQVTLRYRLVAEKPFVVTRENPVHEKLRKALFDNNIAFTVEEARNERNQVERATFTFPCEIKAGLMFAANYETGELSLKTRNIERFGIMEFHMKPEDIDTVSLEELTRLILGENNRINLLFQRIA